LLEVVEVHLEQAKEACVEGKYDKGDWVWLVKAKRIEK
jgi:hypothetical protein